MWFWLFGISIGFIALGLLIIFFILFKFWLKFAMKSFRKLISGFSFFIFSIFDRIFVVNRGKTVEYKTDAEKRREEQKKLVEKKKNKEKAKEYLGAVNFVESLRQEYPYASSDIFDSLVDVLIDSKDPRDFKKLENIVRKSHLKNEAKVKKVN